MRVCCVRCGKWVRLNEVISDRMICGDCLTCEDLLFEKAERQKLNEPTQADLDENQEQLDKAVEKLVQTQQEEP